MNAILHTARRLARFEKTRPRRASIAAALSAVRLTVAGRPATQAGRGLPLRGVPLWRRARLRRSGQTHRTAGPRVAAPPWRAILAAMSFGALLMYIFDPAQGRRRRALAGDQVAHAGHAFAHVRRRIARRGRFLRGVAKGVGHDAGHVTGHVVRHDRHYRLVDNETLVARVRSEVLGDDGLKAGEIHVDAYEGCVTLRGQLDDVRQIQRIINATKHVDGVIETRSYLHLPGEIPPNKAEAYRHTLEELRAM